MMKRISVSIDNELHIKFQKIALEKGSDVSKEISQFMQSCVDGREDRIDTLFSKVEELTDRIDSIEADSSGGFNEQ